MDTLTTVDYQQVNEIEEQVEDVVEDVAEEVNDFTNAEADLDDGYSDAWDRIDVEDPESFNSIVDDPVEEAPDGFFDEKVTDDNNAVNNDIGAFMVERPVLKYKGKDVPIDTQEELIALAQKGFSYETEMSNIKPQKKVLKIVDGVPLEVLQAVADIHNGNKEAIEYIKSNYNIVSSESKEENFWDSSYNENVDSKPKAEAYTPKVEVEDPVKEVWDSYSSTNAQGAAKVSEVYGSLEETFKAEIYKPDVFPAFISSVESGEFDNVYPIAIKHKALNPSMTWIQAYQMAVKNGNVQTNVSTPPPSATPPANNRSERKPVGDADRVWNDEEYFRDLENRLFN